MKIKTAILAALMVVLCGSAQASQIRQIVIDRTTGSYAIVAPDFVLSKSLAANTAESFTVPTGPSGKKATYVNFSSTCNFYANYTTTATVPGDVTNGTASELNPLMRYLDGAVTTISVITSSDTCSITASFYM